MLSGFLKERNKIDFVNIIGVETSFLADNLLF